MFSMDINHEEIEQWTSGQVSVGLLTSVSRSVDKCQYGQVSVGWQTSVSTDKCQ